MQGRHNFRKKAVAVGFCMTLALTGCGQNQGTTDTALNTEPPQNTNRISSFGVYEGFDSVLYDQFVRRSVYVPARDGTRLAVDIYQPAIDGQPDNTPWPVILLYSVYPRTDGMNADGSLKTKIGPVDLETGLGSLELKPGETDENLYRDLIRRGYVIVAAETRGASSSFGVHTGQMGREERQDGYDLIEWLAQQPFSDGNIGMAGGSYAGQIQYATLTEKPPSLKAIFPHVAYFDPYVPWWGGSGVPKKPGAAWALNEAIISGGLGEDAASAPINNLIPVDADPDRELLAQALAERQAAETGVYGSNPFRALLEEISPELPGIVDEAAGMDGFGTPREALEALMSAETLLEVLRDKPELTARLHDADISRDAIARVFVSLADTLTDMQQAQIPAYHWGGWRDGYASQTPKWHANWTAPTKLAMGPWTHSGASDPRDREGIRLRGVEYRRWFDYWLKNIDNGVLDEPAVAYAITRDPRVAEIDGPEIDGFDWRFADVWPGDTANWQDWYFTAEPSNTIASVNDGGLTQTKPSEENAARFTVDYLSTTGQQSRFYDTVLGGPLDYPDLAQHAASALTFTTAPFEDATDIVGFPRIDVWVTSTAADGEFNFYLQEVDANGDIHFLTEATVRARYSALGQAPYDVLGAPWLLSTRESVANAPPLNNGLTRIEVALQPIANHVEAGHRLRLVVTGADADTNMTIPFFPTPEQSLILGGDQAGKLRLPILTTPQ